MIWTFLFSALAILAQGIVFLLGTMSSKPDHKSAIRFAGIIGILATLVVALVGVLPEWDYAYLVPAPSRYRHDPGQILFFYRATANLQSVTVNKFNLKTGDPLPLPVDGAHPPLIRKGQELSPNLTLPVGDWGFEIDALGECGKVREEISIRSQDGSDPIVTSLRVIRKCTGVVICQMPTLRSPPACWRY